MSTPSPGAQPPEGSAPHEPMHRDRHFRPHGEHRANPVLQQAADDLRNRRWPSRLGWFAVFLGLLACLAVGYHEYRRLHSLEERYAKWQTLIADQRALQREDQRRQEIILWQALSEQRLQTARALLAVIKHTPAETSERASLEAEMRHLRDAQEAMLKAATD